MRHRDRDKSSPQRPAQKARAKVLIVDDSAVAREGLAAIIGRDIRFALCGSVPDARSANELLEKEKPDILVIEPFLANCDGIFLIKDLAGRFQGMRILAISKQPEEVYAERVLRAGASGYWMKNGSAEELIHAIETVLAGELYVSARVALLAVHKLVDRPLPNGSRVDGLTDRELHVFALVGAGFGTARIAKELGLSPRTIETYHEHIKLKLGYANAEALHRGAREWFAPGQS